MSKATQAAVVRTTGGECQIEKVTLADLQTDEVLVEVHACGICHMDIEGAESMDMPCVLGHEGAGIVLAVGEGVTTVAAGDRVIMGYGFCGHCEPCNMDMPYFCDQGWELSFGGRRADGSATLSDQAGEPLNAAFFQQSSFALHAITPARGLVRIADDVPWKVAAALPCGFLTGAGTALNVLDVGPRSTLLIRGTGAVGMGAIIGAKVAGCRSIIAVDIVGSRLDLARTLGATETVNALEVDFDAWFSEHYPRGCSHAFDTTGNRGVFESTMTCLETGGTMAYAILPSPMEDFSIKPFPLFVRCASLKAVSFGSAAAAELLPRMLDWWAQGEFPVESMIGTFPLEEINAAISAGRSGSVIKPVLLMR